MPTLNYTKRLANLQKRRFDGELNESLISKSFSVADIPENVKYLAELMLPIPKKSKDKSLEAASKIQKHLENGFDLSFNRAYRTQGSVMSNTQINASDFDFLAIIDKYHFLAPGLAVSSPYKGVPADDILEFRKQAVKILKGVYDEVDDSHDKCISVFNKNLYRKVDIVFAFWYNIKEYNDSLNEYYRGVKFKVDQKPDYPFAHISLVNSKGDSTLDGSRRAIRLLKTLKDDCEPELKKLKSFQLTSIVHSMDNKTLNFVPGNELAIARAVSQKMQLILDDSAHRESLKSPTELENPLKDDAIVPDIKRLKEDLDTLIEDAAKEIYKSDYIQKAIISY